MTTLSARLHIEARGDLQADAPHSQTVGHTLENATGGRGWRNGTGSGEVDRIFLESNSFTSGQNKTYNLLAAGTRGKRYTLPHARIMIHQPLGGVQGQAVEIDIQAREILSLREQLNNILVKHSGQSLKKIEKDTDRDLFMTGKQAAEYGLVDEVIVSRSVKKV